MRSVTPNPKRLIICCDGTWQSSVTGDHNIPSNVTRLARTLSQAGEDADGKVWQQMVYYDSGVGTGSILALEKARQGASGDGLVINVLEAYNWLVNNYHPGDQVYCFGFSRGAFTAKCIAGLVTDIGIFRPERMQTFPALWAAYQLNTAKHDFRKTKEYFQFLKGVTPLVPESDADKPYHRKPYEIAHEDMASKGLSKGLTYGEESHVVQVVGCFDTVGSLGMADTRLWSNAWSRRRFEFLNVKLSPYVRHAFHALALDEHREPFLPTLWYIPNNETFKDEENAIKHDEDDWPGLKEHRAEVERLLTKQRKAYPSDLYQVWFPGVHINIGGGSDKDDSYDGEGLANITFSWMIQMLGPHLAFDDWTYNDICEYNATIMHEIWQYGGMRKPSHIERALEWGMKQYHLSPTVKLLQEGLDKIGWSKEVKLVPARNIIDPKPGQTEGPDGQPFKWCGPPFKDSYSAMYRAISWKVDRTPGECPDRSTEARTPLLQLGRTNEYIHPSVHWRVDSYKNAGHHQRYEPPALKNYVRKQDKAGAWGYESGNGIWIPEWVVKPRPDDKNERDWDHAEWTLTDNLADSDQVQVFLHQIYKDKIRSGELALLETESRQRNSTGVPPTN